ncbi:hypothetical protein FRB91_005569 [Serendipita sp. 411]|nr:hypothetical protein FRB91_005569 [Serendipita sp. 411]
MSSPNSRRSPLWFCYECHAEMRPLMIPDPHCASCNGTFLEEMDGTGEDDPRQIAAENERSQALVNLLTNGLFMSGGLGRRANQMSASSEHRSHSGGFRTTHGPSIIMEYRSGPGGTRTLTVNRGDGAFMMNGPAGFPPSIPSFPEFIQQMQTGPRNPMDDEVETPLGSRRRSEGQTTDEINDPREFLMQYLIGVLSGDPNLMFSRRGGPFQGGGAFGDYVFNQEGLDRIVTQLMEAAGQHKPNPAPEEVISNLKRTDLTFECDLVKSGQSCAICTEYFAPPDTQSSSTESKAPQPDENSGPSSGVAITLPCGHPFHDDCIIKWLKSSGTCPVCRYALVEQPSSSGSNGAAQEQVPGAASTSTNPPPAPQPSQPREATSPPRPEVETRQTHESATPNDTTTTPPPPEAQADAVFRTLGGPGAVLESLFGFVTGRGNRRGAGPGSTRPDRSEASSSGPNSNRTTSSTPRETREAEGSSRPRSPPRFFRDRFDWRDNSSHGNNSRGNNSSRQNHGAPSSPDVD